MGGAVTKKAPKYSTGDEVIYTDTYGNKLDGHIADVSNEGNLKRVKIKLENGTETDLNLNEDSFRLEKKTTGSKKKNKKENGTVGLVSEASSAASSEKSRKNEKVSRDEAAVYCLDRFKKKHTKEAVSKWREAEIVRVRRLGGGGGGRPDYRLTVHFLNWAPKYDLRLRLGSAADLDRLCPREGQLLDAGQRRRGEPLQGTKLEKARGLIRRKVRMLYENQNNDSSDESSSDGAAGESTDEFHSEQSDSSHVQSEDSWASLALEYNVGDKVDVLDFYKSSTTGQLKQKWRPAEIITSKKSRVRIHYQGWPDKWDEDIPAKDWARRLRPAQGGQGRRSSGGGGGGGGGGGEVSDEEFRRRLAARGLVVHEVEADGNCLFRAVGHQADPRGQAAHAALRRRTADHMARHQERFRVFVADEDFAAYLARVRADGVWGDDLEIRALEELLDRPVAIYSAEAPGLGPMNTHFGDELRGLKDVDPIKLSYHGHSHYNSVVDATIPLPLDERTTKVILKNREKQHGQPLPIKGEAKEEQASSPNDRISSKRRGLL